MNRHDGTVRDLGKSIFHRVEPSDTTFDQSLGIKESRRGTIIPPCKQIVFGKHRNHFYSRAGIDEFLNCTLENGLVSKSEKLFWLVSSHSQSAATCHHHHINISLHISDIIRQI